MLFEEMFYIYNCKKEIVYLFWRTEYWKCLGWWDTFLSIHSMTKVIYELTGGKLIPFLLVILWKDPKYKGNSRKFSQIFFVFCSMEKRIKVQQFLIRIMCLEDLLSKYHDSWVFLLFCYGTDQTWQKFTRNSEASLNQSLWNFLYPKSMKKNCHST